MKRIIFKGPRINKGTYIIYCIIDEVLTLNNVILYMGQYYLILHFFNIVTQNKLTFFVLAM